MTTQQTRLHRYFYALLILLATSCTTLTWPSNAMAERSPATPDQQGPTYPSYPPDNCTVTSVELSIKSWVSYSGPFVGDGIPFDFFACPLGRTIHHVMFCLDISMICSAPDGVGTYFDTQTDCFHAGGDNGSPIHPMPNETPPGKRIIEHDAPLLPSVIDPVQYEQFWRWYQEAWSIPGFFGNYCATPSSSCSSMNCGTYLLLLLGQLLGLSPADIAALMPELPPCHQYAYELYPNYLSSITSVDGEIAPLPASSVQSAPAALASHTPQAQGVSLSLNPGICFE